MWESRAFGGTIERFSLPHESRGGRPYRPPRRTALAPVATQAPALQPSLHLVSSAVPAPELVAEEEPSLGSTLIASGILRKPSTPANDPLAPIRRMSQAEKIAFFS